MGNDAHVPVISVIVPVYNVESYLRQCIDSILAQTFTDFELILVDDGSPDNCGAICDEYAEQDSRIVVIHQANQGVSAARNAGVDWVFENSDSQWITFVDGDDVLMPTMFEILFRETVKHQADITITNPVTFSEDKQLEQEGKYIGATSCVTGKELLNFFYNGEDIISVAVWGKLFRRNLFRNLRFPVGKIHEDEATTPILLFNAERVAIIRSWLYGYRQREGSIMHTDFSVARFDFIDAMDSCASYFETHDGGAIAKIARRYHKHNWARLIFTARQEGIYDQVPPQYRMGIVRASSIIFVYSLRSGGITYVIQRIRNFIMQRKLQ